MQNRYLVPILLAVAACGAAVDDPTDNSPQAPTDTLAGAPPDLALIPIHAWKKTW